jgi:hypothetical protein
MQSEAPLTLILSPLRAGRGDLERTRLGSLFGEPDAVPSKVPLSLSKRESIRVRVRFDYMATPNRFPKERTAWNPAFLRQSLTAATAPLFPPAFGAMTAR